MDKDSLPLVACLLTVAAFVAMAVPTAANHSQAESGRTVTFDHKTGNEWWVEATMAGPDAASITKVEAMDTNGPWTVLPKQDWGAYAASFHIEPGHQVRFRAFWSDGDVVNSCWFTHPAGLEQCGTTTTTTTSTTTGGSGFDATFTGVRGNEWWVQAQLASNGPAISKVDVRLHNGAAWGSFMPVTKQSWGWGSSYHIVQGTIVQLRATASDGQTDLSSCRQWIPPSGQDAQIVTCPGSTQPTNVWNRKAVAAFDDASPNDLSIGDADRDGKTETYVPTEDGLYRITAAGMSLVSSRTGWGSVAVGDGGMGRTDVYATRVLPDFTGSELRRLWWDGSRWQDQLVHADVDMLGPVTLGDVDVYGGRDVFVGRSHDTAAQVMQSSWTGSQWLTQVVVDLGDDGSFLDIWRFWIANYDGDSNLELAVLTGGRGYSNAWIVDHGPPAPNVPSQWRSFRLETHAGFPSGMTAGDADGDGKTELILGNDWSGLVLFRHSSTDPYAPSWTRQDVDLGDFSAGELFLADGDNDGSVEVYASDYAGGVHKAAYRNGAWSMVTIGLLAGEEVSGYRVVVGDGDGNGQREVYVAGFDYDLRIGRVERFSWGPQQAATLFDATFTNVQGNQWWVQANVAGNHPLLRVEARVNCGETYVPMAKQSWGAWAASFQVPEGAKVTFRVTSWDGELDASGGYIWPQATPTTGC